MIHSVFSPPASSSRNEAHIAVKSATTTAAARGETKRRDAHTASRQMMSDDEAKASEPEKRRALSAVRST